MSRVMSMITVQADFRCAVLNGSHAVTEHFPCIWHTEWMGSQHR